MTRETVSAGKNRSGFTLVELLVVITILVILATLVAVTFSGNSTDKMRSSARIAQSAFLGAKDRALHAKEQRGIRLIRDQNNPKLFTGFIYLQPLPSQSVGNIPGKPNENDFSIGRDNNGNAVNVQIGAPKAATLFAQDQNGIWAPGGVRMRIPSGTGQWYYLTPLTGGPPYWGTMNGGTLTLTLQTSYQGGWPVNGSPKGTNNAIDSTDANASCELYIGNELLPLHQQINLPSGVVVDLNYCSQNVQKLAAQNTAIDLMFSPRGGVSGYLAALGPMHFFIRDLRDASTPDPNTPALSLDPSNQSVRGECLIVTVFPQSGLVQTFEANLTDANADGIVDNLFSFAQQGMSAGR